MKSILINAYACNPDWGSEQGMGWHWIIHIASFCKIYIITEGEFRQQIERELKHSPYKENVTFFYLPVNDHVRQMCWNQGDWRFYYYYRKWQKRALLLAEEIIRNHKIDIVHQLNMIGFREPGYLWKIKTKPFIWGPIGGMSLFPEQYLSEANWKIRLKYKLKNRINKFQMHYQWRVRKALKRADYLISAIPEAEVCIRQVHHRESTLIHETGSSVKDNVVYDYARFEDSDCLNILWVGRFIFFKQLALALQTVAALKGEIPIKLHIAGDGTEVERNHYKAMATSLGIDDECVWYGNIPHVEVHQLMQKCQLFFFTSVDEATSTVVLEAIENHLPILCFNTCGFGAVVDDTIGYKIPLTYPDDSVERFVYEIRAIDNDRSGLAMRAANCDQKVKQVSWKQKMITLNNLYELALKKYGGNVSI